MFSDYLNELFTETYKVPTQEEGLHLVTRITVRQARSFDT